MFRKLIVGLLAATMIGCAAVPDSLMTDSENPITDVMALSDPSGQDLGQAIRLGGVIAAIDNGEQKTRLEIVAMPIGSDGKPKLGNSTQKRFVAYVDGFLEPMEYHPGRLISVAVMSMARKMAKSVSSTTGFLSLPLREPSSGK